MAPSSWRNCKRINSAPDKDAFSYTMNIMSKHNDQKAELLSKTADYYRRSIANYAEFAKTERKPRTRKQLESRLQVILKEIDSLRPTV